MAEEALIIPLADPKKEIRRPANLQGGEFVIGTQTEHTDRHSAIRVLLISKSHDAGSSWRLHRRLRLKQECSGLSALQSPGSALRQRG